MESPGEQTNIMQAFGKLLATLTRHRVSPAEVKELNRLLPGILANMRLKKKMDNGIDAPDERATLWEQGYQTFTHPESKLLEIPRPGPDFMAFLDAREKAGKTGALTDDEIIAWYQAPRGDREALQSSPLSLAQIRGMGTSGLIIVVEFASGQAREEANAVLLTSEGKLIQLLLNHSDRRVTAYLPGEKPKEAPTAEAVSPATSAAPATTRSWLRRSIDAVFGHQG